MAFSIRETFEDGWPVQTTLALSWHSDSPSGESLPTRVHLLMSVADSGPDPAAVEVAVFPPGLGVPNTPLADSGRPPEECLFYHLIQPGAQPDPLTLPPYFLPKKPGVYNICFRIPARSQSHTGHPARQTTLFVATYLTSGNGEAIEIPLGENAIHKHAPKPEKIYPPKPAPIKKPEPVNAAQASEKKASADDKDDDPKKQQKRSSPQRSGPARAKRPSAAKYPSTASKGCFFFINLIALLLVLLLLAMAFLGVPGIQLFGF